MRPTDKATAVSRSVQSFAIIKNTGNFVVGRFHATASMFTVALSAPQTPLLRFLFLGEGAAVHRLSETDNPSSNCPSKLTADCSFKIKAIPFSKEDVLITYLTRIIKRITRLT